MATAGNSADDRSKSYIPRSSVVRDGWSTEEEATVTCYCGAVQLAVVSIELMGERTTV